MEVFFAAGKYLKLKKKPDYHFVSISTFGPSCSGRALVVIPVWNLIEIRIVTTFLSLISGINVFDYIDRVHVKMPVFYNFMYSLDLQQTVLRPYCNISDFQIWDYYLAEELRHGPSYDYELIMVRILCSKISLNTYTHKKAE